MIRKPLFAALFFLCAAIIFAQSGAAGRVKPRLGILPFTGGAGGDGETIATLFSIQSDILNEFTVVPRTSAVNALVAEQNFQMSGYTDSDTIAGLGRLLNADFVISGHIRRLGNRNLIITTIVNVETFEQLAGDYREYALIDEVPALLPEVAKIIINASRRNTSTLPKLAIAPFYIATAGINVQDAEVLAQILAVEISNTGKYAVLPRTTTIQAAMEELNFQMTGATSDEGVKAMGRAINASYVLSGEVRSLGATNMFTVSILNVEDGSLIRGGYRNYRAVSDGINLMAELAREISGDTGARTIDTPQEQKPEPEPEQKDEPEPEPVRVKAPVNEKARLWTIGVSAGSTFAAPLLTASVHGTIAPFNYSFLKLGFDFGLFSGVDDVGYYSLYPYAHYAFFLPFAVRSGFYAGAGGGYMMSRYDFPEGKVEVNTFAADVTAGFNIAGFFDISYTLRTNFRGFNNKVQAGFTWRF